MRDIKQLHPKLQNKINELLSLCAKNGITIGISECLRTKEEQDALYAQGRTKPGSIITNCKGSTYSSMHQWGVAFDFYLKMDVDGDGSISDDAFNNSTKLFNKVGELGKSIGLEWGGSWKSICDMPHFQLPDWGSTASVLKSKYGFPDAFMATWKGSSSSTTSSTSSASTVNKPSVIKIEDAKSRNTKFSKTYITTANLNLRSGAGTDKSIITTIPKGSKVTCYGYYTKVGDVVWLFVQYGKYTGYVSKKYLESKSN